MEPARVITVARQSVNERDRDRRIYERFALDDAFGHLISRGALLPCHFIDISLGGCCVRTESPFADGALAPVEIVLLIFGLVLRVDGETQWTSPGNLVGVRFMHAGARSKNQLAALLTCLIDKSAAGAVQEAMAADRDLPGRPTPVATHPAVSVPAPCDAEENRECAEELHAVKPAAKTIGKSETATGEEWPAVIRFLESRARVRGLILDLKPEGCTVKTTDPFPGSLHARVELSFRVQGLPFQLAGVAAAFLNAHNVVIRFLDVSHRKREELGQVLEELLDAKNRAAQ